MNQRSSEEIKARFLGYITLVFAIGGPILLVTALIDLSTMPDSSNLLERIGLWLFWLFLALIVLASWVALPFVLPSLIHTLKEAHRASVEERVRRESATPSVLRVKEQRAGGPETPSDGELTRRLGTVRHMSGSQFEVFVADVLRGLGYRATPLGGSGDQGVDVIATAGNERIAIQCKNYVKPVGNKPVQEVYAGSRHHDCTAAWVVAPEGFTKGAVELARSVEVSLHDAQSLREWIRQDDKAERKPASLEPYTLARAQSEPRMENSTGKTHTGKTHTVKVGVKDSSVEETISFAADRLGRVNVNNGKTHYTYYRLPAGTFRVLVEGIGVSILVPSNMIEKLSLPVSVITSATGV